MSVLSSPVPLAWSTPLSFSRLSSSTSAGRGGGRKKGRSSSRPALLEKRKSSSSSSSFSSSSSSSTPLSSPDEPLTAPSDSPSPFLASSSHSPFFSSSTKLPTAFLEFALDSSALPRMSKDVKRRRGRRARSLSPPASASWACAREATPSTTKAEGVRSERKRERTGLPEGWEHIPWITSSSSSDEAEEGDLLNWRTKAKEEEDGERPPSPPQTPSPRLFDAGPILETPPAPASPASSTLTRRRAVTSSGLPTLRDQLSSSPPRQTSTRAPKEKEKSRSAPTSPTKPRCEIVELGEAMGEGEGKGRERRRRRKSLNAKEGSGKRGAREERMEAREENFGSELSTCAPGLGITIPSSTTPSSSSSTQGTFATPSSSSCTPSLSPSCSCDSSDSEEPSDHFTTHFHSLPLLRLRHALSLAATFAAFPPSTTTSSSRSASQRYLSTPVLSSPRPSSSAFTRSVVSEQYRLYAMGRAKAQRTGGVGYWEGGREVWAGVLED